MNRKQKATLDKIKARPERSDIAWKNIESMRKSLGAEITEGNGSKVRVFLNGGRAVFHKPHPEKEADKGAVKSVRRFLEAAGE